MPKKIKLDLENLKIQSFITALKPRDKKELKGGIYTIQWHPCNTHEDGCIPESEYPPFCD